MRIVRYLAPGAKAPAVGIIVRGDKISEVPGSGGDLGVLTLLDTAGLRQVASAATVTHDLKKVKLLAPVGRPGKILCLAANYHPTDKRKEVNLDRDTPKFFIKPSSAMVGPDEAISYFPVTTSLIQEIELGVVIGKPGRNISKEKALDHVFGYTIINDVSSRSLNFAKERENVYYFDWLNGKWLDGHCPVGPWVVDKASIADPHKLSLKTYVNGELRIDSSTSNMIFDIGRQIEYISKMCVLEPGDLIATGVALAKAGEGEKMLQPGDVIEGVVEGVGKLTNPVVKAS
ncbi:MAG: fumarylacetoacetate hydrolase family protein [SAR202 cluster bacterium]|nr:fumarylacetoacetate hydrolase family protein [SAR202 cluster bacterium]